jgi:hypothetical protein
VALPSAAAANQSVHLSASLTPEHLGAGTSIGLGVEINALTGKVPSPLRQLDVRYPKNLGIALSGLGLETCTAATLEALGPTGCPVDSVMGYGSVLGEIPFGPAIIREPAKLTILRAEDQDGHIAMLFDAQGLSPVGANIVLPGLLLPADPPYGGDISIALPLIPSLPEAPNVAFVQLRAVIGPTAGLVYQEHHGAETVSYIPKGILLPDRCPRGGFPFDAAVAFQGGEHATARAKVACPADAPSRHKRHRHG